MSWKRISSQDVYKNRWIKVTEDIIRNDEGKELTYGIVRKKPFALIIPWDGEKLTLVGQYRYPVEYFSWELPQGHYEHDSIEETAREELREETGLKAGLIKKIAEFNLASGLTDQVCNIFLATELADGETKFEESEIDMEMKVKKVTLEEFRSMIAKGEIKDGPTIAAYGFANIQGLFQ